MKRSIFELNERQYAQVRAALRFWVSVARNSRVHPSEAPSVKPEIERLGFLTTDEIEELLDGMPEVLHVSVQDIARMTGRPERTVQYHLRNVEPDIRTGRTRLWWYGRVRTVIDRLLGSSRAEVGSGKAADQAASVLRRDRPRV